MLSLIFTTVVFALISIFLPGFTVSGSKLNLVWLALGYLILLSLSNSILAPFTMVLGFLLSIISIIPIIGPIIAEPANYCRVCAHLRFDADSVDYSRCSHGQLQNEI
jgi:hypothetical protein